MARPWFVASALALALGCTPLRPLGAPDAPAAPDGPSAPDVPCRAIDLCDGRDDDCDPTTEDGAADPALGTPCDGADTDACEEGTYVGCAAGALVCGDDTGETPERCSEPAAPAADEDCDGSVDEAGAVGSVAFHPDVDGDSYGADLGALAACSPPPGGRSWARRGGDCDDTDERVFPGRPEVCDARDDDCDGRIDEGGACAGCTTDTDRGYTYLFCASNRSQAEASDACADVGYHLVTIDDAEENAWLTERSLALRLGGAFTASGAWVGLRRSPSGEFGWEDGAVLGSFDAWAPTEPNGSGPCARLLLASTPSGPTGTWADADCGLSLDYLCETP
jgi:hypothetical protein